MLVPRVIRRPVTSSSGGAVSVVVAIVVAVALTLVAGGCGSAHGKSASSGKQVSYRQIQSIFATYGCTGCHGVDAKEGRRRFNALDRASPIRTRTWTRAASPPCPT